jgi:hypothetical protein
MADGVFGWSVRRSMDGQLRQGTLLAFFDEADVKKSHI